MPHTSRRTFFGLLATGILTRPALAHGPTRQKVTQSVDIARTPDQVWAIVGDFDSIARWHPAVGSSPADKGNVVGSKRTLTLRAPGDPKFDEELLKYDAAARSYQYKIEKVDPNVLPVNNYNAWFEVQANPAGGTTIEWRAAFYRGYMLNDPPPALNDAASVRAITGVFRGGLDNIKALAERAG
ncbi:MAG: SRPBCC family protein [Gemmatimonadaceae bacterium]|nr:SRPBCC family protein [Acetobacteraceae bacterium]